MIAHYSIQENVDIFKLIVSISIQCGFPAGSVK